MTWMIWGSPILGTPSNDDNESPPLIDQFPRETTLMIFDAQATSRKIEVKSTSLKRDISILHDHKSILSTFI